MEAKHDNGVRNVLLVLGALQLFVLTYALVVVRIGPPYGYVLLAAALFVLGVALFFISKRIISVFN
jgi:hypothetical protein